MFMVMVTSAPELKLKILRNSFLETAIGIPFRDGGTALLQRRAEGWDTFLLAFREGMIPLSLL